LCAAGSWAAELFVDPVPGSTVVTKSRYDCWRSPDFVATLERAGVDGLVVTGV
jgi:nicotinamidase-related amidase